MIMKGRSGTKGQGVCLEAYASLGGGGRCMSIVPLGATGIGKQEKQEGREREREKEKKRKREWEGAMQGGGVRMFGSLCKTGDGSAKEKTIRTSGRKER